MSTVDPLAARRRRFMLAGLAGLAAGGAGLYAARTTEPAFAPDSAEGQLWRLELLGMENQTVRLSAFRDKPLLLNFWATWCPPCVEELPLLSTFFKQNRTNGWQVLGIAVDQKDPVKRFLAQAPLPFGVVLAGLPGLQISRQLGNLSGGLPFTVVFSSDGRIAHRKMGRVSAEDLQAWALLR